MQVLTEFWNDGGALLAALGFIVALIAFIRFQVHPAYRLLRLYRAGRPEGHAWRVATRIMSILNESPGEIFSQKSLFKRVRMEIEIECLFERPIRKVAEDSGRFEARMQRWRRRRHQLRTAERVSIDHPGQIQDRAAELDRYFDALTELKRDGRDFRFATKLHIKDGFVAPIHLVAGLLSKFDEDWAKIIQTYEADHNIATVNDADNTTIAALKSLREIQKFIFDCWLQWGPSIPLCAPTCGNFAGAWSSLQYGYGDENNSIELVGSREHLAEYWAGIRRPEVLAARADVTGHIASTRFFSESDLVAHVGPALAKSWEAVDRILLLLTEQDSERTGDKEDQTVTAVGDKKVGVVRRHNGAANYYSAYLWIIFVVLREKIADGKSVWVPANRDAADEGKKSGAPWLDFIPFFEHGNIADKETFAFMKQQLARKAVAGLEKLVTDFDARAAKGETGAYPLRFAFACSLDHPGCGARPELLDEAALASSLYQLTRERTAISPVLKDIVLLNDYNSVHPHSSCTLPFTVTDYFDHVRDVAAGEEAGELSAPRRLLARLLGALTGRAKS